MMNRAREGTALTLDVDEDAVSALVFQSADRLIEYLVVVHGPCPGKSL